MAVIRIYDDDLYSSDPEYTRFSFRGGSIDGAIGWNKLKSIILPLMMPAFTIGLFLSISNAFKLFDQNISLTGGGPVNSTQMLALNIYNTAFGENRFGLAQSKAVIFMIVVMVISIIQLTITKKKEVEA